MLQHKTTAVCEGAEGQESLGALCDVDGRASHALQQHVNRRGGVREQEVPRVSGDTARCSCPAGRGHTRASGSPASLWRSPGAQAGRGSAGCRKTVQGAPGPRSARAEEGRGPRRTGEVGQPVGTWTWCHLVPQ